MTGETRVFVDTHAHLDDDQFAGDVNEVVERAAVAGVRRIVNIGYRPVRWVSTLRLAERFPEIAVTFGLHPHHADEWSDAVERELLSCLATCAPVALGEIGLDYFRNLTPPDVQKRVFRRQIEIAAEYALPVIIHQREAEVDVMEVLSEGPSGLVCILHSFDGTQRLASFAAERKYLLGVGGLMTRTKASSIRDILRTYPLHALILETDSPYLVPTSVKARRNEPANISKIAAALAEIRSLSLQQIAIVTTENAYRIFPGLLPTIVSNGA